MQLTIPPDLQALIEKRMATGAFESAEEVLRCALEAQDEEESQQRQAISDHIEEGFRQAERGELYTEDEVRTHLAEFKERWIKERQLR